MIGLGWMERTNACAHPRRAPHSGEEDELAALRARGEALVRGRGLRQGERLVHRHAQAPDGQGRSHLGAERGDQRRSLVAAARPQGRGEDPAPAPHQQEEIELEARAAAHADDHDAPGGGQRVQGGGQAGRSDKLQDDVVGAVVGYVVGLDAPRRRRVP